MIFLHKTFVPYIGRFGELQSCICYLRIHINHRATSDCRRMLEKTARLVSEKRLKMESRVMDSNKSDRKIQFLEQLRPLSCILPAKLTEYREARNQDGVVQPDYDDAPATRECASLECEGPPFGNPLSLSNVTVLHWNLLKGSHSMNLVS